ncbi:glycosyltransferase [bacterium]|nr:glycosyltransferase [bacterium]
MIWLCYVMIFFLTVVLAITLFNALTAPMLKNGPKPITQPLVSILIPARNEQDNVQGCLEFLCKQDFPHFEIWVLDDQSSDQTAHIVQTVARQDRRIHYIKGKDLPEGWTGKNWACYQLSKRAKGDIFIFTDADNRYRPDAVSKTVGWMQKLNLDLFSAFPQQNTHTLLEKLIVPSVYMTVYCYLPLRLTYSTSFPSLAAANGQWMAFTKEAYQRLGGHQTAKNQIVEDTWLARYAKKENLKILTAAGTESVYGRMYENWSEIWHGFSKNLLGLMGYRIIPFLLLLFVMLMGYICPYLIVFYTPLTLCGGTAILLNIIIRLILTGKYKDPAINILLHPLAILMIIIIGLNSMRLFKRGELEWKGRKIVIDPQGIL